MLREGQVTNRDICRGLIWFLKPNYNICRCSSVVVSFVIKLIKERVWWNHYQLIENQGRQNKCWVNYANTGIFVFEEFIQKKTKHAGYLNLVVWNEIMRSLAVALEPAVAPLLHLGECLFQILGGVFNRLRMGNSDWSYFHR